MKSWGHKDKLKKIINYYFIREITMIDKQFRNKNTKGNQEICIDKTKNSLLSTKFYRLTDH